MTSTVNYIAQDTGAPRRGRPGAKPAGMPGRTPGGSRQPDPMTSTVNYIARGHGQGPRGAGGNFRRNKGRNGLG